MKRLLVSPCGCTVLIDDGAPLLVVGGDNLPESRAFDVITLTLNSIVSEINETFEGYAGFLQYLNTQFVESAELNGFFSYNGRLYYSNPEKFESAAVSIDRFTGFITENGVRIFSENNYWLITESNA